MDWKIILIVIGVLIAFIILTYNTIFSAANKVNEAKSNLDIYLRKRWDLIPNIVNTVKGYAKHETDVLKEIIDMRSKGYNENLAIEDQAKLYDKSSSLLAKLISVSESYPDLKADSMFLELTQKLSDIEGEIASARAYYNARVRTYNYVIGAIPNCFVAKMFNFTPRSYFETSEETRQNVKVEF